MRTLALVLTCFICPLFSVELELPETIYLSPTKKEFTQDQKRDWGFSAFNGAPEIGVFLAYLKAHYQIDTMVETGTYRGGTTLFFSFLFDEVHTIEIVEETYKNAKEFLSAYPNIHCHLGSSEETLKELLPTLQDRPVLFYLDAHWYDHWPLLQELEEISKTHRDNCIIVIDDFKVPHLKHIGYDAYGEHECSLEYIEKKLDLVFSDYTYHYIIPTFPRARAKFVAVPKGLAAEHPILQASSS